MRPIAAWACWGMVLVAVLAAAPAPGQTPTAGQVVIGPKIHPRVLERAQSEAAIPVFIVLQHQPQREIVERAESANALYREMAESRYRQTAERVLPDSEDLRQAREAAEAVILRTRQQAFQAIEQAIGPEQAALEGRLRGLGATRISRYLGINMLTAEIPASAIAALEADPVIAQVLPVEQYRAQLANSVPALGAPAFWNAGFTGQGESVGILDTGIKANHPAFAGKAVISHVFLANGATNSCFGDDPTSVEDQHGHGTFQAGVVASEGSSGWTSYQGVAKGLGTLYNLKVAYRYSAACNSLIAEADSRDVLAALDWAVRNTPLKTFNYSYGNPMPTDDDPFAQAIDQYIDNYGLTITIAAGFCNPPANGIAEPGDLTVNTPGNAYNSITVGSWLDPHSCSGTVPFFNGSSRSKPDLLAPGNNVFSTAYNWDSTPGTGDDFANQVGTSAAAAHIAGAVALLGSAGVSDPLAGKAILLNSSDWVGFGYPPAANLTRTAGQLNYVTGTVGAEDVQLCGLHATADLHAALTWNRHIIGGAFYLNHLYLYLFDAQTGNGGGFGGLPENVIRLPGSYTGDFIAAVNLENPPLVGVTSEPYAVAFSVPCSPVTGPHLSPVCSLPSAIPSGSQFAMTCSVTNDGDVTAVGVTGQLGLPSGFALSGLEQTDLGTIQPGGVSSLTFNLTAPAADGAYAVRWNVNSAEAFFRSSTGAAAATAAVHSDLLPPRLISPANGSTGVSAPPTLVWTVSKGATSYDVYFGTAPSPPLVTNTVAASYALTAISPGTLYYWRVVANNGGSRASSATWSFATQSATPGQRQYLIATVAGSGQGDVLWSEGNPATSIHLSDPEGVAAGAGGRFYIADTGNSWIRNVAPDGTMTTIGNPDLPFLCGYSGSSTAFTSFYCPVRVVVDAAGNLYVSDDYFRVLKITPGGVTTTVVGHDGPSYSGDGGPAGAAQVNWPYGLAVDAAGDLFIADFGNHRIRKVTPNGTITTVAGNGENGNSGDGGPATSAQVGGPQGIAVDAAGDLFISDVYYGVIRKVTPDGTITTVAGSGYACADPFSGYCGEGGPALDAVLEWPLSVAVGDDGLYIAAPYGSRVVRVDPNGILTTVAGGVVSATSGDGGPATSIQLDPRDISIAKTGEIYVAGGVVRVLVPVDPACQYQVSPTALAAGSAGGSVPISIKTAPGCAWTAGFPSWVNGKPFGKGPATLSLSVAPNPGALRSETMLIAGTAVTITQGDGVCGYSLSSSASAMTPGGGTGTIAVTTGPSCPWTVSNTSDWVTLAEPTGGVGSGSVSYTVPPNYGDPRSGTLTVAGLPFTLQQDTLAGKGLSFTPVTPCRVADTRFAGPTLAAGESRSFNIPQSGCGVPPTAQAYSLNVTVVPPGPLSYLTLWPTGQDRPFVSTLNSFGGSVVANAAIVPAGTDGAVSVYVTDPTDVILDIDGYFDYAAGPGSFSFYPAQPCRVADTRGAAGPFGAPSLSGGQSRDFPVPSSSCGLPSTASAYSMNVTVVPDGYLGYLTTWPTGQAQPNVSTLNSWTGKVVANAAIVPAGTSGFVSVYVSNPTAVILDTNGYFGAPGGAGALNFYPVTPCRVADTRSADGPLGGPEMEAGTTRPFPIPSSACGIPAVAAAYSLNVTVVPDGVLSYLTAWPAGSVQPFVSTLNSWDGAVVANAAIVPAGAGGAVSVYVTGRTHVILDINGYFAP